MIFSFRNRTTTYLLFLYICILWVACKKEEETPACSYTSSIKPIINSKCAIPDCHNGGTALADFTTYEGLKTRADNGRIRTNVFELKIMPPASASPLTDEEKELIKCWLDNGAPQD